VQDQSIAAVTRIQQHGAEMEQMGNDIVIEVNKCPYNRFFYNRNINIGMMVLICAFLYFCNKILCAALQ